MKTVLVVDDEKVITDVVSVYLNCFGYNTIIAHNGFDAINLVSDDISLIMLDIKMPVMDGIEAYYKIRESWLNIPIIIYSGYGLESMPHIIDTKLRFVAKPFEYKELNKIIEELIYGNRKQKSVY